MIAKIIAALSLLTTLLTPALAGDEACRIRVQNRLDGLVQVSVDKGDNWSTVGRVKTAANARIVGFAAAAYVPHGTVAATAVHGIRVKSGQYTLGVGKAQKAMLFSIEPREFWRIPSRYGGHQPRSSGVYTDIFTGRSIFRNESPYVGNAVYLERKRQLEPLPEDYTPVVGDTFVIIVTRPDRPISEVQFENKAAGKVSVIYPDATTETIAAVDRPVRGTGRYDATTFTGVGAVNTNHGGVLTISTAPTCLPMTNEGGAVETRGGFMIQPYFHVKDQGEESPQVMVVGPKDSKKPHMEGTPPIFFGNINLSRYRGHPEASYRAQIRIDDGQWEDVPQVLGKVNDSFSAAYLRSYFAAKGTPRDISQGVTAVRLLFPTFDADLLKRDLLQEAEDYGKRVTGVKTVSKTVYLPAPRDNSGITGTVVNFYVDGVLSYMSSADPCSWNWDSRKASNGLHEILLERVYPDGAGGPVTRTIDRRLVLVKN